MQALSLDKVCDSFSANLLGSILRIIIILPVKIYDVLETESCSFPGVEVKPLQIHNLSLIGFVF